MPARAAPVCSTRVGDIRVTFLPDVYGRDPAIVAALGRGFAFRRRPVLPDAAQPPA